jgi:hypothetical protein
VIYCPSESYFLCPEDADIKHLEQGVFKPASTSK